MTGAWIIPDTYFMAGEQLALFGGACLLGIPVGMLFDAARLLRRLLPHHSAAVAAEDVLCIILSSFLLLGYTAAFARGEFRLYYAAGCLLGFVLYECTLGRVVITVGGWFCKLLRAPFRRLGHRIASICRKLCHGFVRSAKKQQKVQKIEQNPLKRNRKMVYNKGSNVRKGRAYGKSQKNK